MQGSLGLLLSLTSLADLALLAQVKQQPPNRVFICGCRVIGPPSVGTVSALYCVCSFVEGSLGFLSGLVSLAELIPLARQHRDKMLTKVLAAVCLWEASRIENSFDLRLAPAVPRYLLHSGAIQCCTTAASQSALYLQLATGSTDVDQRHQPKISLFSQHTAIMIQP